MEQESVGSWENQQGKRVVLLEPDSPWYIRRGRNPPPIGIIEQDTTKLNDVSYDNAEYKTNFMMDTHRGHMGYGHSYASRQGRRCQCLDDCPHKDVDRDNNPRTPKDDFLLEHFGMLKSDSWFSYQNILFASVVVLVSYYIFKMYWSWRSS
jgi:hypothetical protein